MFLETEFWMGLLTIIMIDLVLAGDNAVVIALACRNLPKTQRNKAILWGTIGAVVTRVLMTLGAVWLLKIPFLQALGGVLLIFVAIKLLNDEQDPEKYKGGYTLGESIRMIIAADLIMGVDNVLAIAGASQGNFVLVVFGLGISIPIVIWGSRWIVSWMDRFPIIVDIGAIVLAWTSGTMIVHDRWINSYITTQQPWLSWAIHVLIIGGILLFILRKKITQERRNRVQ